MVILFFGFTWEEITNLMPNVVRALNVQHPYYSACPMPATLVYDAEGNPYEEGRAIGIPGFEDLRENPGRLKVLSEEIPDVPIFVVDAPVEAYLNGKIL